MKFKTKQALCIFVIAIGILKFLAYVTVAACLGGGAINGWSENGHDFLSGHRKDTEVSETIFNYSRIHTYCVWITHPMALVAGLILFSRIRGDRIAKDRTRMIPPF